MINWLFIVLGAVPALVLSWLLHTVDVGRIEARQAKALTEQATQLQEQCTADKHKTQELVDALQATNASINGRISALKLRKPSPCIKLQPAPATSKHDGTTGKPKPLGEDGSIAIDPLLDIAGDGDKWGAQLDICQRFIRDVWKANNQ